MPVRNKVTLATNAGVGAGAAVVQPGGRFLFAADSAAWGGGNAKLQMKTENGTWVDCYSIPAAAYQYLVASATPTCVVDLPAGEVRIFITTATGVYASLLPMREGSAA